MSQMIMYHNDLNKFNFYLFDELEQNIILGVFLNAHNKSMRGFSLSPSDIAKFLPQRKPSNAEILERVRKLRKGIFKMDYEEITENEEGIINTFYNVFSSFTIKSRKSDNEEIIFESLDIKINEDFLYLVKNLLDHFTKFDLEEFLFLSGKYTKILYMHLKQFRTTGEWIVRFEDFKRLFNVPNSYKMSDIDSRIIKPAITQLSSEVGLFDTKRIPFKNLFCIKKKGKGRGRGGTVTHLIFKFSKQNTDGVTRNSFVDAVDEAKKNEPLEAKNQRMIEKIAPKSYVNFIDKALQEIKAKKQIIKYNGKGCYLSSYTYNPEKNTYAFILSDSLVGGNIISTKDFSEKHTLEVLAKYGYNSMPIG